MGGERWESNRVSFSLCIRLARSLLRWFFPPTCVCTGNLCLCESQNVRVCYAHCARGSWPRFKNNPQVSADATFTCRLFRPIGTPGFPALMTSRGLRMKLQTNPLNKPKHDADSPFVGGVCDNKQARGPGEGQSRRNDAQSHFKVAQKDGSGDIQTSKRKGRKLFVL